MALRIATMLRRAASLPLLLTVVACHARPHALTHNDLQARVNGSAIGESGPFGSGAILSSQFNPMQRDAVFWGATAIAVLVSIAQGAIMMLTEICEAEGLWTVRFKLGVYEHWWWTGIAVMLVASLGSMVVSFLAGNSGETLGILVLSTASSLAVFRYAWPAWRNRHYCFIRWIAWTGPSRTGIEASLVPYIGGPQEWKELNSSVQITRMHPVETRPKWLFRHTMSFISADPTDLLRAAHALQRPYPSSPPAISEKPAVLTPAEKWSAAPTAPPTVVPEALSRDSQQTSPLTGATPPLWKMPTFPFAISRPPLVSRSSTTPSSLPTASSDASTPPGEHSHNKPAPMGLYEPVIPEKSASLLWGLNLGFDRRVSRGILIMPKRLLTSHPRTEADHDGRSMCLAHGILARNKGLAPTFFILHLDVKKLEEKSVQWPRPAKVLRSYYAKEMKSMYEGLGDAFVKTATELALLLADSHHSILSDWFNAGLEHQDLLLNRKLHDLGASSEDLQLLYRLSYAAMLVSLSSHVHGHHMRPEMTIFTTYLARVAGKELPEWTKDDTIQSRLAAEKEDLTADLDALVEAVLPPYQPPPPQP